MILQRQVGAVKAVDGVDLVLNRGATYGLVGESGCGKIDAGAGVAAPDRADRRQHPLRRQDVMALAG